MAMRPQPITLQRSWKATYAHHPRVPWIVRSESAPGRVRDADADYDDGGGDAAPVGFVTYARQVKLPSWMKTAVVARASAIHVRSVSQSSVESCSESASGDTSLQLRGDEKALPDDDEEIDEDHHAKN